MRNKKKSNYGSNFNLVKNPLSAIQSNLNGAPNSNNKISHLSKNKTYHQSSNSTIDSSSLRYKNGNNKIITNFKKYDKFK